MIKRFETYLKLNEGIQDQERLDSICLEMLNKQIVNELESSFLYRAMACWLDVKGWVNGFALFTKYANEEHSHSVKIYEYLSLRNSKGLVQPINVLKTDWTDIRNLLEESLEHEMKVTKQWNNIANCAKQQSDTDLYELAIQFVKEQTEEEEKFRNLLFKLDRGMPEWKLEEDFKEMV